MPIYEYRCERCGDEFEVLQRFGDRPLRRCKKCGGRLEKLLSRSSFILKGGGWFSDGYSGSRPRASSGSGGGKKKDSGSDEGGKGKPGLSPPRAAASAR